VILEFHKKTLGPGMTTLEIKGSIHCGPECTRLEKQVDEMIAAKETKIVFDMTGVTHMDSAAIGALVRCLTKLKKSGGGLHMAAPQPMIEYSLKLTKLDKLIPSYKTVGEAAAGFAPAGTTPA
jgi:anti-anti-sigma factor